MGTTLIPSKDIVPRKPDSLYWAQPRPLEITGSLCLHPLTPKDQALAHKRSGGMLSPNPNRDPRALVWLCTAVAGGCGRWGLVRFFFLFPLALTLCPSLETIFSLFPVEH